MTDDDQDPLTRRLHWDADESSPVDPDSGWDLQRNRVGAAGSAPDADTDLEAARAALTPVRPATSFEQRDLERRDEEALDRRRQLWRDTAIILSGIIIALLLAQLVFPSAAGVASASPTPVPTGVVIGPSPVGASPLGFTFAPIVDPSLGIDASPTPVPVRTLPPTGTSAPTLPGATPRATPHATHAPSPTPTPTPTPTPEITPAPTAEPTPTPEITPAPTPEITPTPTPEITPEVTQPPPTP